MRPSEGRWIVIWYVGTHAYLIFKCLNHAADVKPGTHALQEQQGPQQVGRRSPKRRIYTVAFRGRVQQKAAQRRVGGKEAPEAAPAVGSVCSAAKWKLWQAHGAEVLELLGARQQLGALLQDCKGQAQPADAGQPGACRQPGVSKLAMTPAAEAESLEAGKPAESGRDSLGGCLHNQGREAGQLRQSCLQLLGEVGAEGRHAEVLQAGQRWQAGRKVAVDGVQAA